MEERLDDLEGRSRRCNIRVLGLLERIEGTDAVDYMETWTKSFTPSTDRTMFFSIERAHRVPARPPIPGARLAHCWRSFCISGTGTRCCGRPNSMDPSE